MLSLPAGQVGMHGTIFISTIGVLGLVALELRSEEFRGSSFRDRDRMWRNWSFMAAAFLAIALIRRIDPWVESAFPRLADWSDIPMVDFVGAFLVADLFSYLSHFVKHRFDYLWRFHFQH